MTVASSKLKSWPNAGENEGAGKISGVYLRQPGSGGGVTRAPIRVVSIERFSVRRRERLRFSL
jgi:hypothetical protein